MSAHRPRWRIGEHVPLHVYEQTGATPNVARSLGAALRAEVGLAGRVGAP